MRIVRPITISESVLVSSNVAENDYAAYSSLTSYALAARVLVVAPGVHDVYESLQAANMGHDPATSPTWWIRVGATNRWRMFDGSVSLATANAETIDCAFALPADSRIDTVALFNLAAASLRVV